MCFLVDDDRYVYHKDRYMTGTCVYDSLTCVCTCVSVTDKCTATRTVHMYTVHINTGREFMVHSVSCGHQALQFSSAQAANLRKKHGNSLILG